MSESDFGLWAEEMIETPYLHECPDGGSTTTRLSGSDLPTIHLEMQRCVGCGERPMLMRAITPDELAALNAGLWSGLPNSEEV